MVKRLLLALSIILQNMKAQTSENAIQTPYTPYFIKNAESDEQEVILGVLSDDVEGAPKIPEDCLIWTNGCMDCEVSQDIDGNRAAECPNNKLAHCNFSKCLPFCKKFKNKFTPTQDCVSWYDGCNRCFFINKKVQYQSTKTGQTFELRANADMNSAGCTKMYCQQLKEPKCLKHANC